MCGAVRAGGAAHAPLKRNNRFLPRRLEWDPPGVALSVLLLWMNGGGYLGLLLLAALIHEGGHLVCAGLLRRPVAVLRLGLMGARLLPCGALGDYSSEAAVAFWGAGANFLAAIPAFFAIRLGGREAAIFFFFSNLFLGLSNLLPAEGLDGGVILYALAAKHRDADTAHRLLRWTTLLSLAVAAVFSLWVLRLTGRNLSVLVLCLGLLLGFFRRGKEKRPL